MGNGCVSLVPNCQKTHSLTDQYKVLNFLGHGASGIVFKCKENYTNETVALKVNYRRWGVNNEADMMDFLMLHKLDKHNIIKFHQGFFMNTCLVFEICDISLKEYIQQLKIPMFLQDIRDVMQQLATAFNALKNVGVVHCDLKTNNIMLVDGKRRPLQVKLIDFGLAIYSHQASSFKIHQHFAFKAPELILGLPYSEAVDIWSLGCVMAAMVFNHVLFPGESDYETLCYMIDLLGPPPDHLLCHGPKPWRYFKRHSNQWVLKTPEEYWKFNRIPNEKRVYHFSCLDEAKKIRLECQNPAEAVESCIELLKMMLKWDEKMRIPPNEILIHSFITMNNISVHSSSFSESIDDFGPDVSPAATVTD